MDETPVIKIPVSDNSDDASDNVTNDVIETTGTPVPAPAETPADTTETIEATNTAAPEDPPQDVFEKTKALQLQAWQAQSDMDGLLSAMTLDELKSYASEVAVRQQASPEGSEDRAVWDALQAAAGVKRDHKQLQETEEQTNE